MWINFVNEREHYDWDKVVSLGAYTLFNVSVAYRILDTETVKLGLEVTGENLLDENYEEEEGYPMPGAMW